MYIELFRCRRCGAIFRKDNIYYNKSDVDCLIRSMVGSGSIYYAIHECDIVQALSIAEFHCFMPVDERTNTTEDVSNITEKVKEINNVMQFKTPTLN